jgi:hypothetical protein
MKNNFLTSTLTGTPLRGNRRKTKNGGRILLKNNKGEVFAALVKNKHGYHLVSCQLVGSKPRYMYSLSDAAAKLFRLDGLNYSQQKEKIELWGKAFLD